MEGGAVTDRRAEGKTKKTVRSQYPFPFRMKLYITFHLLSSVRIFDALKADKLRTSSGQFFSVSVLWPAGNRLVLWVCITPRIYIFTTRPSQLSNCRRVEPEEWWGRGGEKKRKRVREGGRCIKVARVK